MPPKKRIKLERQHQMLGGPLLRGKKVSAIVGERRAYRVELFEGLTTACGMESRFVSEATIEIVLCRIVALLEETYGVADKNDFRQKRRWSNDDLHYMRHVAQVIEPSRDWWRRRRSVGGGGVTENMWLTAVIILFMSQWAVGGHNVYANELGRTLFVREEQMDTLNEMIAALTWKHGADLLHYTAPRPRSNSL